MYPKPKYQLTLLVVCGNVFEWKAKNRCNNEFSSENQVIIGPESDTSFILTFAAETWIAMPDDKLYYIIQGAMKNIKEQLTKDPRGKLGLIFRTTSADGNVDLQDQICVGKFDRVAKLL
jgi:hypothetical protein